MRMSVRVDLHKSQFTVYWRSDDGITGKHERYRTTDDGYRRFEVVLQSVIETGTPVEVGVESTGNTRYFKQRVERCGVPVRVVNTAKFKVVTDRHDAATLAEFLEEKDMLPEAHLCSPESEELRRVIKTRKTLVETIVTVKNQLHGLLLSMGIESKRGQLQSAKERRRVKSVLAAHHVASDAVDPLFETIDRLFEEVKKLDRVIADMTEDDKVVQLIKTIPGAELITVATIRAFTDDIRRQRSTRHMPGWSHVCHPVTLRRDGYPLMTRSRNIIMAMTRRTWIRPPMVFDVTSPKSHRTIKTTAIVVNIPFTSLFSILPCGRNRSLLRPVKLPRTGPC